MSAIQKFPVPVCMQPAAAFDDGLPVHAARAYRLPGSNLTVVVMLSPTLEPAVGVAVAEHGQYDPEQERIKALCNALDNSNYAEKPGRRLSFPVSVAMLTERERLVVDALRKGLVPKQIALDMDVNLPAVRRAMASVLKKTDARTTEQAIYRLSPSLLLQDMSAVGDVAAVVVPRAAGMPKPGECLASA